MSTAGAPAGVGDVPVLLVMAVTGWSVLKIVGSVGVDPSRVVLLFGALLLALVLISREATDG